MQKSLKVLLFSVMTLILLFTAACANKSESSGSAQEDEKIKVGFAVSDATHPFMIYSINGIKEGLEPKGIELMVASANNDVNTQIAQIENLVASKVKVLIVNPLEPNSIEGSVQKAREAGVKVISYGNELKNADVIGVADNKKIGKMLGEYSAKWINEKFGGNAEIGLIVSNNDPSVAERGIALEENLMEKAPNAKIVAKQDAISVPEAQKVAETMLLSNPDMRAIVTVHDSMAIGALEAVKAAGRATDDFFISGSDATPEVLTKIKEGEVIRVTVDLGTNDIPKSVVDNVFKLLNDEEHEKYLPIPLTLVDGNNVDQFIKE